MIYLHIPFCRRKCTYCGFYSVAQSGLADAYVQALCSEIHARGDGHTVRTLYFGGGTPTLLTINQLKQIGTALAEHFDLSKLEEATIEANPESLTPEYLGELRSLGLFNRLSIGIQSLNDSELRTLNRVHGAAQARQAVAAATAAGFDNLSVDLIYGLPNQAADDWQRNLDGIAELLVHNSIRHISCYELTVEPDSIMERQLAMGRIALPDEETVATEYEMLLGWCQTHGFQQYEVSNFAQAGYASRHNSRYWDRTPYMGFGAAAHSFDGQHRRWNAADVRAYIHGAAKGKTPFEEETLTGRDAYNELVMTALRTTSGLAKSRLAGPFEAHLQQHIAPLIKNGLIEETDTAYRPTARGLLQADGIASQLMY